MSNKKIGVYIAATAAMIFWGASFVWTKVVFKYYGPFTTVFIRLVLSTLMLTPILLLKRKRKKILKEDIPRFLLLAFFEPFCYFIGEYLGMMEVSSTLASVIIALIPVIAPVFTFFFLRERLTKINILGLIISFTGVAVFVTEGGPDFQASPKGILLLSFAVLSAVAYGITAKRLAHKYSPLVIVRAQNFIGAFYFLPLFFFFEFGDFVKITPNAELVSTILMLALFGSTLAFLFMTKALKELGVTKTNIFTNTIPLFTAIFAYFILGERFSAVKIAAMFVVIGGIFLSQINKKKKAMIIHED